MLIILLCSTLFALNLIDTVCTLDAVANGAWEVNPVMRYFLDMGTAEFVVAKLGLVACGCIVLYLARHNSWCLPAVGVLNFVYLVVCFYHVLLLGAQ